MKKRKYQKRKKLDQVTPLDGANQLQGTTGLSKLEGTKLIIQKKAFKLALNNSEHNESMFSNPDQTGMENSELNNSGAKKRPRIPKKLLKTQLNESSSLMVVDQSMDQSTSLLNQSSDAFQTPKLKIINKNKPKSSLILHIPKEKLGTSFSQGEAEMNEAAETAGGQADLSDQMSSPSKQPRPLPGQPQPKRQYNKQNSLLKKQQKLMLQQQQQLELQLKMQMSQGQFNASSSSQAQFSATAASQFANLFEIQQQQQLMLAFQQLGQQQNASQPNTPLSALFQSNPFSPNASGKQSVSTPQSSQSQQLKRKQSTQNSQQMDYLIKPHLKKADRRHADPLVSFALILENILNELRDSPDVSASNLKI